LEKSGDPEPVVISTRRSANQLNLTEITPYRGGTFLYRKEGTFKMQGLRRLPDEKRGSRMKLFVTLSPCFSITIVFNNMRAAAIFTSSRSYRDNENQNKITNFS
jgi:hypothetical protein